MAIKNPIPIFRSFDEQMARKFYVEFLGLKVDWEHRFEADFPLYMQVSRDDLILHLSEHHGDATPGSSLRVEVKDIDAYREELTGKVYKYANPGVQDQPWGTRDMMLTDPFGNKLIFYSDLDQRT